MPKKLSDVDVAGRDEMFAIALFDDDTPHKMEIAALSTNRNRSTAKRDLAMIAADEGFRHYTIIKVKKLFAMRHLTRIILVTGEEK